MNILLACSRSKTIGLGHFSRMLALRNSLAQAEDFHPYFSVLGDNVHAVDSKNIEMDIVSALTPDYFQLVRDFVEVNHVKLFIMDFHKSTEGPELLEFLKWARAKGIVLVAVDSFIGYREYLDHIWLPSVHFDVSKICKQKGFCDVSFGWDHFLLERVAVNSNWQADRCVLVMTGGADVLNLGDWLPELLDTKLEPSTKVDWVKGPYATFPMLPINPKLTWSIHDNPRDLNKLISESSYILTQFGVSFFEAVQAGIPTVVMPLDPSENRPELDLIQKEEVALVAHDIEEAADILALLIADKTLAENLAETAKKKMRVNGCDLFVSKVKDLMSV